MTSRPNAADRLLEGHGLVVEVGVVEVECVDTEALQRRLGGGADVRRGKTCEVGVLADLGRHDDTGGAARGEPLADEPFAVPTGVARHPGAVAVGGVDEVAAARDESVEDREGLIAVGRPAEHVAAE